MQSDRQPAVDREDDARDVAGLLAARKPTAGPTSAGSENRPMGIAARSSSARSGGMDATMSVSALGEIGFTVMPKPASSFAVVRVKPMMPAFAAA